VRFKIITQDMEKCDEALDEFIEKCAKQFETELKKFKIIVPKEVREIYTEMFKPIKVKREFGFILFIPAKLSFFQKLAGVHKKMCGSLEGFLRGKGVEIKEVIYLGD